MSHRPFLAWAGAAVAAALASTASADEAKLTRWHEAFAKEVRPVLEAKCLSCHSGEKAEGEFDLAPVAKAERPIDHATVRDRVAGRVRLDEMPPAATSFNRRIDELPAIDSVRPLPVIPEEPLHEWRAIVESRSQWDAVTRRIER